MTEIIFIDEMAQALRITKRAMRSRINDTHRVFWQGKVIGGYRKSVSREDFEKYLTWLKRSGLEDGRGRKSL